MRLFPASVVCVLLTISSSLNAQPVQFVRESLLFRLAPDSFDFSGLYYFDNPGPTAATCPIYYPFVIGDFAPDSTAILETQTGRRLSFTTGRSGVSFIIEIPAYSTRAYRISFRQRSPRRLLEYLLTTTATWDRPLDRATVTVISPDNVAVKEISMKPDSVCSAADATTYIFERENFMPNHNLTIRW